MNHPLYRVRSCEYIAPYSLRLRFDDGLVRTIDFEPILEGELYGPLSRNSDDRLAVRCGLRSGDPSRLA